jgi:hypothetical protein
MKRGTFFARNHKDINYGQTGTITEITTNSIKYPNGYVNFSLDGGNTYQVDYSQIYFRDKGYFNGTEASNGS